MSANQMIREQLLALLRGGNAHMTFDEAIADFPLEHINKRPANVPYSFWHLLEHMRIAQWDILDFIRNPNYKYLPFPEGLWPAPDAQAEPAQWAKTVHDFHTDWQAFQDLLIDRHTDLTAPIPHAPDYTIFREILVVADHNAYHIGEFAILRQTMSLWPS